MYTGNKGAWYASEATVLCDLHHAPFWLAPNMVNLWKMQFFVFPILPAQLVSGGIVKRLLIAYFIGSISAKNIKICSCVSKL